MVKHLSNTTRANLLRGIGYIPDYDFCAGWPDGAPPMSTAGASVILKRNGMPHIVEIDKTLIDELLSELLENGWYVGKMSYLTATNGNIVFGFEDHDTAVWAKLRASV